MHARVLEDGEGVTEEALGDGWRGKDGAVDGALQLNMAPADNWVSRSFTVLTLDVGVNCGPGRVDVAYTVDSDLEAIEGLNEAGSLGEVGAVVESGWSIAETGDRVPADEVIENSVRVTRDVGGLELMGVLAEDVVEAAFDVVWVEVLVDFEVHLT
jgi:hypothetical protein